MVGYHSCLASKELTIVHLFCTENIIECTEKSLVYAAIGTFKNRPSNKV